MTKCYRCGYEHPHAECQICGKPICGDCQIRLQDGTDVCLSCAPPECHEMPEEYECWNDGPDEPSRDEVAWMCNPFDHDVCAR